MTIFPITTELPACLGVACERHAAYQRYHDVERFGSWQSIGTCHEREAEYPLFVPVSRESEGT